MGSRCGTDRINMSERLVQNRLRQQLVQVAVDTAYHYLASIWAWCAFRVRTASSQVSTWVATASNQGFSQWQKQPGLCCLLFFFLLRHDRIIQVPGVFLCFPRNNDITLPCHVVYYLLNTLEHSTETTGSGTWQSEQVGCGKPLLEGNRFDKLS